MKLEPRMYAKTHECRQEADGVIEREIAAMNDLFMKRGLNGGSTSVWTALVADDTEVVPPFSNAYGRLATRLRSTS